MEPLQENDSFGIKIEEIRSKIFEFSWEEEKAILRKKWLVWRNELKILRKEALTRKISEEKNNEFQEKFLGVYLFFLEIGEIFMNEEEYVDNREEICVILENLNRFYLEGGGLAKKEGIIGMYMLVNASTSLKMIGFLKKLEKCEKFMESEENLNPFIEIIAGFQAENIGFKEIRGKIGKLPIFFQKIAEVLLEKKLQKSIIEIIECGKKFSQPTIEQIMGKLGCKEERVIKRKLEKMGVEKKVKDFEKEKEEEKEKINLKIKEIREFYGKFEKNIENFSKKY